MKRYIKIRLSNLDQRGSILLPFIITLPFLIAIVGFYMNLSVSSYRIAHSDQSATHAQLATDAGLDIGIRTINLDNDWTGTGGQVEVHNDGRVRTTYEVITTHVDDTQKNILSIGRTFRPASSSTAAYTTRINVSMRPVTSGEYSIVGGVGGLIMSNNAKVLGGSVFVNGKISLTNNSQIGLASSPVASVQVAHQSCPFPATSSYPRVCNSGENGQPITLTNSSRIYGAVTANNQTNGASMSSPGLVGSSGIVPQPLPSHDRAAQKVAASAPVAPYNANWSCNSGNHSWPANLKITGNVSITNSCKVTVNGNIWITGNLTMSNSSQMIVSNTLGATKPDIMVDGRTVRFSNSSELKSNTSNAGFRIINYWSKDTCSPDCSDVTGAALYDSSDEMTIELSNNASGPHTIFYSRWTKVKVTNSGQIGALVGQMVELSNSGTITFGTATGTGTSFWIVDDYRRVFAN